MKSWYFDTINAMRNDAGCAEDMRAVRPGLPARERRLAFFEERAGAFAHVVGGGHQAEERRFVILGVGERHVASGGDRVEDVAHGHWRLCRQHLRQFLRFVEQLRGWDYPVDQA